MTTRLALLLVPLLTSLAVAQPADPTPCVAPCAVQPGAQAQPSPQSQPPMVAPPAFAGQPQQTAMVMPPSPNAVSQQQDDPDGWHQPVGRRFFHGFRLGWIHVNKYDTAIRDNGMTLKEQFGLKSPDMMIIGYEGYYRIIGHSWLNVLMLGNVTVAGLDQSKFIPAASGLLGFELDRNFQLGIGVNVTPDPQAPSHMIAAAGWTPSVGSIQTPIHFFYLPDPDGNSRYGATVGMNW